MQGDVFDSGARARTSDPSTSKEAAKKVTNMRASQARVLAMFKLYGDLHDKQLIEYLHDAEREAGFKKLMSDSGVRTRRSELAKPNMDRLTEIVIEMEQAESKRLGYLHSDEFTEQAWVAARARLLIEGVRSPLWDTGKREMVDGRNVTVWGIAK
jgi:hypothetical protein